MSSSVLYQTPFITPPLPIKLGLDHEIQTNREYLQHAMRHGKHQLTTRKCGFITHPTMGFLGDAYTTNPHCELPKGIAELNVHLPRMMLLHWKPERMTNFIYHTRMTVFI